MTRKIPKSYISLKDAADEVGKWIFGLEWTGQELTQSTSGADRLRQYEVCTALKEIIASREVDTRTVEPEGIVSVADASIALNPNLVIDIPRNRLEIRNCIPPFFTCEFNTSELTDFLKAQLERKSLKPKKRPGNPGKYKWDYIHEEMRRWVNVNGAPNPRSELVHHIQEWYIQHIDQDQHPSDAALYDHMNRLQL